MPFTPFHAGPGVLLKSVLHEKFSLLVFLVMQVVMDIEPLLAILTGRGVLHGWTHTLHGAFLLALVFTEIVRRALNAAASLATRYSLSIFRHTPYIHASAAWVGSVVGVFSHVLLDAVMHTDMLPFFWLPDNPLHRMTSVGFLHVMCVFFGVLGLGVISFRVFLRDISNER